MENIFQQALGVESPWFIESTKFDAEKKRLDIEINYKRGWRFPLEEGGQSYPVHDTEQKTWRHLNFFQHECYLNVRVPRVRTESGRTITVLPPWAGRMLGFTLLFESLLLQLCRHMPVAQVAEITNVSANKLWRMIDVYVAGAGFDEDLHSLTTVGIDETSVAKGHDYITLFVDMTQRKTLHIADGKGSETVNDFAKYLTEHQATPEQIESVSCDMSPAFIKGVKENLPRAQITFDKFHIVKIINEAVDKVRREEAKSNPLLKNNRYIFLKNEENLTSKQRTIKKELDLPSLNIKSMDALRMRETFQQIYHAQTEQIFKQLLQKWLDWVGNCNLEPMKKAAQMVQNHLTGIHNWMRSKINNGILEGLNSIIQAAKRKARGYGKRHFAVIALFLTGKLNFQKLNQYLPTHFG